MEHIVFINQPFWNPEKWVLISDKLPIRIYPEYRKLKNMDKEGQLNYLLELGKELFPDGNFYLMQDYDNNFWVRYNGGEDAEYDYSTFKGV
jgi:hypothetical protein